MFVAALFTIARTWSTKMSINRWMDKEDVVHIYNGMLLSHKKDEIMPFAAIWLDLKLVILSDVSQRKTNMWYCIYVESKQWYRWTYLQNRNRITDVKTNVQLPRGKREMEKLGDWDWHIHTAIYKIDNQWEPTVQHRELCFILGNGLNGPRI